MASDCDPRVFCHFLKLSDSQQTKQELHLMGALSIRKFVYDILWLSYKGNLESQKLHHN